MTTVMITGADRGIGAALCELWAQRGATVIASCLEDGQSLEASSEVEVVSRVDVTASEGVRRLQDHVGDRAIDVLVNNAGMASESQLGAFDFESFHRHFAVNALAPLRVTEAFLKNLGPGSKVGIVTSRLASLGENQAGGLYAYRMSKAAANMAGINLAHELKPRGIAVICLHPGSVRTQMAGGLVDQSLLGTLISPYVAAEGLMARLDELTLENTGTFRHANGQPLPW